MIEFKNRTLDELMLSRLDEEVFEQLLAKLDYLRRTTLTNAEGSTNSQRFERDGIGVGLIHPKFVRI
jgi:hypothetical protein